ncbi:DNA polymerase (family 10) [Chitinophaga terrae (ex Kim and Jung 2007)]|uniref:DNA polymerase (Family 10) n=1 Tax=Chitinophaga terrae (ex Kim and Jung 2007) TaxID=408074 RepID=A0A1H4GPC5_9BACT|nr:hypothetical protein [Chitinophaga terrae (ex Kim and Jung 2007)]MDQ0110213.1 DNA polymerase (family 10) [Chitinophaga terrae (ex Kim and Jung 2007)]GEP93604.1 DNA polymerase/3'-5' exonuclease PolX [Chitinophaga terrae (ex Kim and Jung 2007)]SEB10708.1 DNA polymerase (family 10) [Chitinophaga terrae (ex Kim and Jung 2007)]
MKSHMNNTIPDSLADLLDIRGITTSKLNTVCRELEVGNLRQLSTAAAMEQLENVPALSPEDRKNIKRYLKVDKDADQRILLWDALLQGREILRALRTLPEVEKASLAGSLRRGKDTIGDVDIVVQVKGRDYKKLLYKIERMPFSERIITAGRNRICVVLHNQLLAFIYLADEQHFGAALWYYTGSKSYNALIEHMAADKGYRIDPLGLYDRKTNKYLATKTEEDIFNYLEMDFIPPELREEQYVIDKAIAHKLPPLVTFDQLKGDMQLHSDWSDGEGSIEHMARYIFNVFPHYQYIVITDHASANRTGHVLEPGSIYLQAAEINRVNDILGFDYVKKGVEVDILENGELSLPDELLQGFDWVIASVHSQFARDNTSRLLKACENPYVHCIGHPSGRIIGSRNPYPVNWDLVFDLAAATSTAMEINARPNRLDLNDSLIRKAITAGVKLVINTDAHNLTQLDFIQLGVWMARKGGCSNTDILNTLNWKEIEKFKNRKLSSIKKDHR